MYVRKGGPTHNYKIRKGGPRKKYVCKEGGVKKLSCHPPVLFFWNSPNKQMLSLNQTHAPKHCDELHTFLHVHRLWVFQVLPVCHSCCSRHLKETNTNTGLHAISTQEHGSCAEQYLPSMGDGIESPLRVSEMLRRL